MLLANWKFIDIRTRTVNTRPWIRQISYERQCVEEGELYPGPEAAKVKSKSELTLRAIFLLNPRTVEYFSDVRIDFWYALSTGVSAIWKIAFRHLKETPYVLADYNSLLDVSWTEELETAFSPHESWMKESLFDSFQSQRAKVKIAILMGFLRMDRPPAFHLEYFAGRVHRLLGGQNVLTKNDDIEILFEEVIGRKMSCTKYIDKSVGSEGLFLFSGYLYPITAAERISPDILGSLAFGEANMELLLFVYTLNGGRPLRDDLLSVADPITRRFVKRVRLILEDARLVSILSDSMFRQYQVVAGEILDELVNVWIRLSVGNPHPEVRPRTMGGVRSYALSVQSLVIYDPVFFARVDPMAEKEAFRLGQPSK